MDDTQRNESKRERETKEKRRERRGVRMKETIWERKDLKGESMSMCWKRCSITTPVSLKELFFPSTNTEHWMRVREK